MPIIGRLACLYLQCLAIGFKVTRITQFVQIFRVQLWCRVEITMGWLIRHKNWPEIKCTLPHEYTKWAATNRSVMCHLFSWIAWLSCLGEAELYNWSSDYLKESLLKFHLWCAKANERMVRLRAHIVNSCCIRHSGDKSKLSWRPASLTAKVVT